MYSLVSAPVLGFDLCRLEGGAATAGILLRSLSLTPDDLGALSRRLPDDGDRLPLWQDIEHASRAVTNVAALPGKSTDAALALLERAPIGNIDGLVHCVRNEILDWTWSRHADEGRTGDHYSTGGLAGDPLASEAAPDATMADGGGATNGAGGGPVADAEPMQSEEAARATAVVCDAAAASYLRTYLPAPTRRKLAAAWLTATYRAAPPVVDLGPQHAAVTGLFDRLREARQGDATRLVRAVDSSRGLAGDWAPAIHSASWAVYVSGRIHAAAAAQLQLVLAVDEAGISVADRACGVWNLLSGTVQALVVRDMLDEGALHRLISPALGALGPFGLS